VGAGSASIRYFSGQHLYGHQPRRCRRGRHSRRTAVVAVAHAVFLDLVATVVYAGAPSSAEIEWIMMLKWPDVLNLARTGNPAPDRKIVKTDAEWRQQLGPEEYQVTRKAATEHPFSSQMCGLFEPGIYSCVCCETVLFDASEKFESGTGWPSFTQPVTANAIAYRFDGPAFLKRVETICNTCDAHLGHVFPDGPPPSGLRYCMNAVALKKSSES
jgi:peptide-methionine (R)-S-oxide reductase